MSKQLTPDEQAFLQCLSEGLPPLMAREKVETYLGGAITGKTLANYESLGKGPEVAYRVGRKVMYETGSLLKWLVETQSVTRLKNLKNL